ncbi:MAG: GNAT family N-acetyltransferase [Muribaculaceae bacterium]|nr:GNAT family N-acetyltransferase [Muribaculaceae bacterium]
MSSLLNNEVLALRALEPTDLDLLFAWENDASLWLATDTSAPYSRQLLWQYLKSYTGDIFASRQLRLMIELQETHEAIGTLDFFHFDPWNNRAEVGLYVAAPHRGNGYGSMAMRLAVQYARDHVGMRLLYGYALKENEAVLHAFASAGFTCVATLPHWVKRGTTYHTVQLLYCSLA